MDMEVTAWMSMYHTMHAQQERRPFSLATLRRIGGFARPHRRPLGWFLLLSVATAALAVATPVLAGRVVDAIVHGAALDVVLGLAALIAVIALAEAGLGVATRWLSASIGEDLILDLRTAVFDHVQRMPIAFFTRTRTGALVSRLNNDVIGAQRAFSDTLSGVVSNLVTLVLTLVVMIGISWQITMLALLLLPAFVLPARRMGTRLARLERESANHNAMMSTQMTERFSAPGATLVKLFGRPARESAEFASRARRVRDIGVRTAMVQSVFVTALTLVSALALAVVYGLGGFYALRGQLEAGAVVALALLLTRLYAPLTALASARVEVMSALVSFERVFEVLDLTPLIRDKPDARRVPEGPVSVELDQVHFGYPAADRVSLASLEQVAKLDERGGVEVLHGVSFRAEPGQIVALVGSSGAGKSTIAQLMTRLYDVDSGAVRLSGVDVRDLSAESIRETLGMVTQDGHLFHESVRANLLLARPEAAEAELWEGHADGKCLVFADIHAAMAELRAGREAQVERRLASMRETAASEAEAASLYGTVGIPVVEGLAAFHRGDWATAVERLLPVRVPLRGIGGSHAQRDIVDWTLTQAAIRAGERDIALSLAHGRLATRPRSAPNRRFLRQAEALAA